MRFFGRERELGLLRSIREESRTQARLTILKGRRRVGKTSLLQEAFKDEDFLYFFVARKNEADLCGDFQAEMARFFGIEVPGRIDSLERLFRYLLELAEQRPFTLVVDEFQELLRINPSVFSTLQRDWDLLKARSRVNLVVSGSINRLMEQIFSADQPLYGRATHELTLRPFTTSALRGILAAHAPGYTNEDLLALWTFTGGVAKYVELLMDAGAVTCEAMVERMISDGSTFFNEGKVLLVDEFGKDYGTYFSILSLIASGHTSRSEIQSVIPSDVGGYLTKLESDYRLIAKRAPVCESSTRNIRYMLEDEFLRFWFRFVWKFQALVELRALDRLRDYILRDYSVFSGRALEAWFMHKFVETGTCTRIGNWWDRHGENEIDLVVLDEFERSIRFCEIKRMRARIDLGALRTKAEAFKRSTGVGRGMKEEFAGLSLEDM